MGSRGSLFQQTPPANLVSHDWYECLAADLVGWFPFEIITLATGLVMSITTSISDHGVLDLGPTDIWSPNLLLYPSYLAVRILS